MTTVKPRIVSAALTNKGFREVDNDHHRFILYHGNQKTEIRTMVSHSSRELGEELIHRMARQLKLSKPDFLELVGCTLGGAEYLQKLRDAGVHLEDTAEP